MTVSTSAQRLYVSQQASLTCAFAAFPDAIQRVTWFRRLDAGGTEVILTADNGTSPSSSPAGGISSRVDGSLLAASHNLRINATELGDERDYICTVLDFSNNTASNVTTLRVLCEYAKDFYISGWLSEAD